MDQDIRIARRFTLIGFLLCVIGLVSLVILNGMTQRRLSTLQNTYPATITAQAATIDALNLQLSTLTP